MESFGATLRERREQRKIDLNTASTETHISVSYLDALEKEKIAVFPGETYLIGFMRNYAEYLGLNASDLIEMYHAIKIQIDPAPLDRLLEKKKKIPWYAVIGAFFVVAVAVVTVILVLHFNKLQTEKAAKKVVVTPQQTTYELGDVPMEKRVYQGDIISVPLEDKTEKITVLDTFGSLTLQIPTGTQIVELGEETDIDLDGVPGGEVSIYLSDVSVRDSSRGAEIQVIKLVKGAKPVIQKAPEEEKKVETPPVETVYAAPSTENYFVIFEGTTAYPVTLNAVFRGSCLFRYEVDRNDVIEDYISSGETVSFSANNAMRLWMSNANAVKLQVIGGGRSVDLEIGRPGHVVVEDIKWIKDESGKYKLVVIEVD